MLCWRLLLRAPEPRPSGHRPGRLRPSGHRHKGTSLAHHFLPACPRSTCNSQLGPQGSGCAGMCRGNEGKHAYPVQDPCGGTCRSTSAVLSAARRTADFRISSLGLGHRSYSNIGFYGVHEFVQLQVQVPPPQRHAPPARASAGAHAQRHVLRLHKRSLVRRRRCSAQKGHYGWSHWARHLRPPGAGSCRPPVAGAHRPPQPATSCRQSRRSQPRPQCQPGFQIAPLDTNCC